MRESGAELGTVLFNDSLIEVKEVKNAVSEYLNNIELPDGVKKQLYDRYLYDIKRHADRYRFSHDKISKEVAKTFIGHALSRLEAYTERFVDEKDERINPFLLTKGAMQRSFEKTLAKNMETVAGKRSYIVLVSIDADDFKKINDSFNHETGDDLLRSIGKAIDSAIRPETDYAAHYSGDEFGFMLNISFDSNQTKEEDKKKIEEIIKNKIAVIQSKVQRPDGKTQELSTGFVIIDQEKKNDFRENLEKSDEASELAKRVKIIEESHGNYIKSPDRIINSDKSTTVEGEYGEKDMAVAKAERSMRRALTDLEETLGLKDINIHELAHQFIQDTIARTSNN